MAKVFKAQAALRKYREKSSEELFEKTVNLINEEIIKASEVSRSISITSDDEKFRNTLFVSEAMMDRVLTAFQDDGGYYVSVGVCLNEPEYLEVILEW
jgi:hypothetical protein